MIPPARETGGPDLARRIAAVLVIACLSGALGYTLVRVLAAEGAMR